LFAAVYEMPEYVGETQLNFTSRRCNPLQIDALNKELIKTYCPWGALTNCYFDVQMNNCGVILT